LAPSFPPAAPIVLVVEDEPLLRMMAVDLVEDAGFDALEAADGDEAVRILETRDDIRVVFTDVHMPGKLDGVELAARVRDRWPPVGIIVTSGRMMKDEVALPSRGVFLAKPYSHRHVVQLLQQMTA
jgi:CheY-like chemotaxis protein